MAESTRRGFIRQAGAAAAGMAAARAGAQSAAERYAGAVRATPNLMGWWRLNGGLADEAGKTPGVAHGDAVYAPGPLGGQGLSVAGGRYVSLGALPALDVPEATVEMFFAAGLPRPQGYNECLIAARSTSAQTRFSIHIMATLDALAVWNGQAVSLLDLATGPIAPGQWRHLVVTSSPGQLRAWVDGAECRLSAPGASFSVDRKALPWQIGASSPEGAEAACAAVADVALYSRALTPAEVAAHIAAAGWEERARRAKEERDRREAERRRAERAAVEARLRDPALTAPGAPHVYADDHLSAIGFAVGGIGTGLIQMNGRGERGEWQIFNNYESVTVPDTFLAIRAAPKGGAPVVRALQTTQAGAFQPAAKLALRAEYPFAWYDFADPALPVRVTMEVFSPFIPMNAGDSALPCAIFRVIVENTTTTPVTVAVLSAQQNAVGIAAGVAPLARLQAGYGGNVNRAILEPAGARLTFGAARREPGPSVGEMAMGLRAPGSGPAPTFSATAEWTDSRALLERFSATGALDGPQTSGPTPRGETSNAAAAVQASLPAGERRTFDVMLTWRFPNVAHGDGGWTHPGNAYAARFHSAAAALDYVESHFDRLTRETHAFHDAMYAGNLPRWLTDRITSQMAILRSKTCFWAADGYFGAYEGCAPGSGCCTGSCTHVWHYAQGHARLFPELARMMRRATYGYQRPDGGLPHRHPSEFTAADGELGDILGAWREHLTSGDGAFLKAMWPGVRRAMEHAITTWDADEDGVLHGAQWNTLDGALGGSTSWIGTLYLAALGAAHHMALLQGDATFAARCARIRQSGAEKQNATLFNGTYYIQIRDPEPRNDYADGCCIDQLLGEWWAAQVGLEPAYPRDRRRTALQSLVRHNFRPSFKGVQQSPRKFVADEDAGLQMICWPGGRRPSPTILYGDEVMTGFEYAAAGAMIQSGLLREGLMVARAISERYDGRRRENLTPGGTASWGYSGNPFGDDECGKFYARAMSVWSLLLACQGFEYDGPAGRIGFHPAFKPDDHASFFTGAEGWGIFRQKRVVGRLDARIELRYGSLRIHEVALTPPGHPARAQVTLGGRAAPASVIADGRRVTVRLASAVTLRAGETLRIQFSSV